MHCSGAKSLRGGAGLQPHRLGALAAFPARLGCLPRPTRYGHNEGPEPACDADHALIGARL